MPSSRTRVPCRLLPATIVASLAILGTPAPAAAKTVGYNNIVSPSKRISCYAVQRSSKIECMASYIPRVGEGDPYLGLRPRGEASLSGRSDYPGYFTRRRTLRYGDVWARPGIRCTMRRRGLTCRNRSRHGFHIAKGNVRRF